MLFPQPPELIQPPEANPVTIKVVLPTKEEKTFSAKEWREAILCFLDGVRGLTTDSMPSLSKLVFGNGIELRDDRDIDERYDAESYSVFVQCGKNPFLRIPIGWDIDGKETRVTSIDREDIEAGLSDFVNNNLTLLFIAVRYGSLMMWCDRDGRLYVSGSR